MTGFAPVLPGSLARSGEEARPGTRVQAGRGESDGWGAPRCAAWRWQAGAKRSRSQPGPTASSQGRGEEWRRGKMLGRNGPGASEDRGPGRYDRRRWRGEVTLRGYFSIMASCPGRPVVDVLGKSAGATTRPGQEEAEEGGGGSCLLRRSGRGPTGRNRPKHMTWLPPLLLKGPLPASSKGTVQGPPSQSSG